MADKETQPHEQADIKVDNLAKFNIIEPWLSLDAWQEEYIKAPANQDCFLLCGRQVGKSTAMSIKAVELCMHDFKKGDTILICSITEKQGYHVLLKCLNYAEARYPNKISRKKEDKPTMHRIVFKNGSQIFSFPSGDQGIGLRGFTIKKLLVDEASRMSDEFFISVLPMLSVAQGSIDMASTPCGKRGFFYEASKSDKYKKFYISSEDCPRHNKDFLAKQKETLSKMAYAQEYLAMFIDELRRLFDDELISKICTLNRPDIIKVHNQKNYIGVDVAGLGQDECTYEVVVKRPDNTIEQVENIIEKRNFTTDTARRIIELERKYNFKQIGIDDAGVGFGVYSALINDDTTKRKVVSLNNARRGTDTGDKSVKLLKEEMYFNLLALMEQKKIKLLNDDEVKVSLRSVQYELTQSTKIKSYARIFGSYTHIAEGLVRACWLAEKDKTLNLFIRTF